MLLAQSVTDPNMWNEYGLPGMVMGVLFLAIGYMYRASNIERKESQQIISTLTEGYRSDVKSITDLQNSVTLEVTNKFVDLHKEQAMYFKELHQNALQRVRKEDDIA